MIENMRCTSLFILWYLFTKVYILNASMAEKELIHELFVKRSYNKAVRPVDRGNQAVNVTFNLALFQLADIDEKAQTIELSVWIRQMWTDSHLTWDPKKFDGIKEFNMPPDQVWLPDIVLYNNVNDDISFGGGSIDKLKTRVIVYNTGVMFWLAPAILKANCVIDVKDFPFDTQHCFLQFGSWTYDMSKLDVIGSPDIDVAKYLLNSEWHLTKYEAIRSEVKYNCCPNKYPDRTFHFYFSRRSLFFILNLVFPIVVITLLTSLAFLLPAESGERISLAVTLMLAVTVFMLLVAETTPATSDAIPLVSVYFIICLVTMTVMIIGIAFTSRLYHRESTDGEMGDWTRKIFLNNLSFVVRIQKPRPNRISCVDITSEDNKDSIGEIENIPENKKADENNNSPSNIDDDLLFKQEWRIVAMTMDRCLFIFFILFIIISSIGCFSHTTFIV